MGRTIRHLWLAENAPQRVVREGDAHQGRLKVPRPQSKPPLANFCGEALFLNHGQGSQALGF